jgi:glyoxylase-like metal-dependent hydrolase (beta-lactamase superfamily II)
MSGTIKSIDFGKIKVVQGQNSGRFPFCNSILINDAVKAVIDPGAGKDLMMQINDHVDIDLVINTHFHFDHIAYNYIFDQSKIYINDIESECYQDRKKILKHLGMTDYYGDGWAEGWLDRISRPDSVQSPYTPQNRHEWWLSTAGVDGTYRWGDIMDFGTTKMEVIGTPGHSAGFCCLHFPNEGIVYTGDIDLTSFGPWCFGADGDMDQFIKSAEIIANLNAETYVTGHEAGIVNRGDFQMALRKYIEIIAKREERILVALAEPISLEDLCSMGLIYGKKFLIDEWVHAWDSLTVKKHLDRLFIRGMITYSSGKYLRNHS